MLQHKATIEDQIDISCAALIAPETDGKKFINSTSIHDLHFESNENKRLEHNDHEIATSVLADGYFSAQHHASSDPLSSQVNVNVNAFVSFPAPPPERAVVVEAQADDRLASNNEMPIKIISITLAVQKKMQILSAARSRVKIKRKK